MPTRLSTSTLQSSEATPVFPPGPRYRIFITFHCAHDLPVADIPSFSSDPYIIATLRFPNTSFPKLHHRTPTIRSTREPTWANDWGIANIPVTGVILKVKVMDEDPGDHDDMLGVAHIETGRLDVAGMEKDIETRQRLKMGKGAWVGFLRLALSTGKKGVIEVGIKVVDADAAHAARTECEDLGRPYTISPNWWSQHSSPLIGIIAHTTATPAAAESTECRTSRIQRFEFRATKIQLSGPLPAVLKHPYVAFRPIIKTFYTKSGLLGIVLNRALKHQYRTIYSYDKATVYGVSSPANLARKLLEFAHWGEGGRVYTYIITLDGEWRFTETGKEFGIQMLSKHTMHSCVSIFVAFAGEFYIRGLKHDRSASNGNSNHQHGDQPSRRVEDYVLVIDNDSGTYRPPKECLPALHAFMGRSLPGLAVETPDAFDEKHAEEKKARVEEKGRGGRTRFKQLSRSRSPSKDGGFSSSDEEELQTGHLGLGRKYKMKAWRKVEKSGDVKLENGRKVHVEGKGKGKQGEGSGNGSGS